MKRAFAALAAALALTLVVSAPAPALAAAPAEAQELGQKDIESRLTCQCGCGLTVATCNHLQCSFAVPVREGIRESLAAGQTGEQILARYVEEYGEKILSSPTTKGFNLLAWIGPYAAVLIGGILIVLAIRRWSRRPAGAGGDPTTPMTPVDQGARDRIARELEDMEQ